MAVDLTGLPDDQVMVRMAACLKARGRLPVGSRRWATAVLGYEECKREMDRRLIEHVVEAARERHGELGEDAGPGGP